MPSNEKAAKLDQQQKFGQSTVNSGKFSNNFDVSSGGATLLDANQASTSKAAAAAKAGASDDGAMAVAKYTGGENGGARDLLRMNSVLVDKKPLAPSDLNNNDDPISYGYSDEVNGHLDNVQDELDTLKDLLRGDGVSIDQNMLLGVSILSRFLVSRFHPKPSVRPTRTSWHNPSIFMIRRLAGRPLCS